MMQRFGGSGGGTLAPGDTANHPLPSERGGVLYMQASPSNVGNVTIRVPFGSSFSSAVMTLEPGAFAPPIGPIERLDQFAYQLGNTTDSLQYAVIR